MSQANPARPNVRLREYQPPAFFIDNIELVFDLDFAFTQVHSRIRFRRNPDGNRHAPLQLQGEDLLLVSIALDDRELDSTEYRIHDGILEIPASPEQGTLQTIANITPSQNTRLEGLYQSGEFLVTQCEAEGFRRITFFPDRPDVMAFYTVTLRANPDLFPVLLSNGNPADSGKLADGRHYATWVDPWPKPSYLFALVAGRLGHIEDHFITMEGRRITLRIYAENSAIGRCQHALDSLKRALRWDETEFGRCYDLDVFNIVATFDFNMGAMENKGLNIFNAKGIVADPETATDSDLAYVEAVVAHEYFHNWTGNRITCRDWFQLSLKEGLTVYRDQEFSADMASRAVKRIDDVRQLRTNQFPEDSGPFAHAVRPEEYAAISNFYTATVYEKGAEVVRLYRTLLGQEGFRRGIDLYFQRHDGQAVTVDDFRRAMGDANGLDLDFLLPWYTQAGTPQVYVAEHFDAAQARYRLDFRQLTQPTPGQPQKQPLPIPVRLQLYDKQGDAVPLRLSTESAVTEVRQRVLLLDSAEASFEFVDIKEPPVASLMQDFSAPVQLHFAQNAEHLAFRIAHDRDPFNRWEAAQYLGERLLLAHYDGVPINELTELTVFGDACERLLSTVEIDPALVAECLDLPDEIYTGEKIAALDPERLHLSRRELAAWLGARLTTSLQSRRQQLMDSATGGFNARSTAARRLRGRALSLLMMSNPGKHAPTARQQFASANTMTERMLALTTLVHHNCPGTEQLLGTFYQTYASDPLLVDKWLALQASNPQAGALERVRNLIHHPAFSWRNPNKVRALIGVFARSNRGQFHQASGDGYRLVGEAVATLDALNPQIAARMVSVFNGWRRLEPLRQSLMRAELERIAAMPVLSLDTREIVTRALL